MDLATILQAIELVGDNVPALARLYEGFIAKTEGVAQAELKERYASAQRQSDALHGEIQRRFGAA